jgi:hypothetical protein
VGRAGAVSCRVPELTATRVGSPDAEGNPSPGANPMAFPVEPISDPDFGYHVETYRAFVKWGLISVAHVALVLVLLAYFFA